MEKQKKEENAIPKTITIYPRHEQFIEEHSINLSKYVQKKIDEDIKKK